jgi:hypothetical protein
MGLGETWIGQFEIGQFEYVGSQYGKAESAGATITGDIGHG